MDNNNRERFTEILSDMVEQAGISGNVLTMDEIHKYFEEIPLGEEQMSHIYAYLAVHQITVKGYVPSFSSDQQVKGNSSTKSTDRQRKPKSNPGKDGKVIHKGSGKSGTADEDSLYLRLYLQDLEAIRPVGQAEEKKLLTQVCAGQEDAVQRYVESKLGQVVTIAREYQDQGVLLEDLIQEGNIQLMAAVQGLSAGQPEDMGQYLGERIRKGLEEAIQENFVAVSADQVMVAKVNFVSESAKNMKEENGVEPTLAELAVFTNLTVEEIAAIMKLSAGNLEA